MGLVPREEDIANMPISKKDLKALFDRLDRTAMAGYECDHSFALTKAFLQEKQLPQEAILQWLSENGAGCDCEIMFNVAENWEEIVGYVAPDSDDHDLPPRQGKKPWWKFW